MRTILRISTVLLSSLLLVHCSSSDDGGGEPVVPTVTPAAVNTVSAENVNGLSVTLNGNITNAGTGMYDYGFCIGTDINPTLENARVVSNNGSHTGAFSQTLNMYEPNRLYHVRAYARTSNFVGSQVVYGNDITFSTTYPIENLTTKNIITNRALFRINVLNVPENVTEIGVCYGTIQNPTLANSEELNFSLSAGYQENTNIIQIDPLTPNTVYYARPYYEINNNQVYYGAESSFRTAGYFGPAGGYVAFDKGESTDGWRYLEVNPTSLMYSGNYVQWGCYGTLVSNTYPEMGTGLTNTTTIVSGCGAANCAARLCYNFVKNSYTDWFLGSRDEMVTVLQSLRGININLDSCWTSTETTAYQGYTIYTVSNTAQYHTSDKDGGTYVFPIRRY
ncbi:hypothetical protein [Flavobacterium sp.]|uniref:hypothetical protein n=1 Tax=Flavobacterium sp. TaxID=239 RepID=UPI0039E673BF